MVFRSGLVKCLEGFAFRFLEAMSKQDERRKEEN